MISIIIVGAIVAFFLMKRRSRKPSLDVENVDKRPFAPLASNEVHGNVLLTFSIFHVNNQSHSEQ